MLKEYPISKLTPGMYITEVTQQSGNVSIKTSGIVRDQGAINTLTNKGVLAVIVDINRSEIEESTPAEAQVDDASGDIEKEKPKELQQQPQLINDSGGLNKAQNIVNETLAIQEQIFSSFKSDNTVDVEQTKQASNAIVTNVLKNKEALACVTKMQDRTDFLAQHGIQCAVTLTLFANYLKFNQTCIEDMVTAALLHDLGMIALPDSLLQSPTALTEQQRQSLPNHLKVTEKVFTKAKLSKLAFTMIMEHHERLDGSGYPAGSTELEKPSQILALVDCYCALTSERPYRKAYSATAAFKILRQQGDKFDQQLLAQFVTCLGIYPVGTLVKTASDKLALVIKHNQSAPNKPVLQAFYSIKHRRYIENKVIDLAAKHTDDAIVDAVLADDFQVDLVKFFKQVLLG